MTGKFDSYRFLNKHQTATSFTHSRGHTATSFTALIRKVRKVALYLSEILPKLSSLSL
jgi:hypothetical protein